MFERKRAVQAVVLAVALCAGCGEKADHGKHLREEREKHQEEIARVRAEHAAEIEGYREKLRLIESEMDSMGRKAALATTSQCAVADRAETDGEAADTKAEEITLVEDAEATTEEVEDTPPEGMDYLLEWFAYSYAPQVEAGKREQFKKDFDDYIEGLREQAADEPANEKKDIMLDNLRERIAETTDEGERELLEDRVAKIENASEDDLPGVIDYYQRLDNIRDLNELMDEYNISRQELRESGIEPPPRDSWWPDAQEIAYNLNDFVDRYESVADAGVREEYRKDFSDCIAELTAKLTEEEVLQKRDLLFADLEQKLKTADDRERRWIERRMRWLESADRDRVRRILQMENLRNLNQLTEKYGIPSSELSQSGVWFPGSRRR